MGEALQKTPYDLMGGEAMLRLLVNRFYDVMLSADETKTIRAMHAADLSPMREKLFDFLSGWLGGPNLYFQRPDRKCMGEAHASFAIGAKERDEWLLCMKKAMADVGLSSELQTLLEQPLFQIANAMRSS
jgi:hemoglobin